LFLGFLGVVSIGPHRQPIGFVFFSAACIFLAGKLASGLRPVSITIDHSRGIVSFRPRFLSRRIEIPLERIKDVALETAIRLATRGKGGGVAGIPSAVAGIYLVLEDEKVPIDTRMSAEVDATRAALAKMKEALQAARPADDS
jgi:hypothetical protein